MKLTITIEVNADETGWDLAIGSDRNSDLTTAQVREIVAAHLNQTMAQLSDNL